MSSAKEPYKRDYILQKRPIIVATPYQTSQVFLEKDRFHVKKRKGGVLGL